MDTSTELARPAERKALKARPPFAVGQVWRSASASFPQTIVAITRDPKRPIVTQDDGGDVWCYDADGRFLADDRKYDLVQLVRGTL